MENQVSDKVLSKQDLLGQFIVDSRVEQLVKQLQDQGKMHLKSTVGSGLSFVFEAVSRHWQGNHVFIGEDKEHGAYVMNDIQSLNDRKNCAFFPASYTIAYQEEKVDNGNVLMRAETLQKLSQNRHNSIFTHPIALAEKVVSKQKLSENTVSIHVGEKLDIDFISEYLIEFKFEMVDYVYEPGQFSIRGGIVDIFSFANEYPFRVELFDDEVESIRTFDPVDQLSKSQHKKASIIPNVQSESLLESRSSFVEFLPNNSVIWVHSIDALIDKLDDQLEKARRMYEKLSKDIKHLTPEELFVPGDDIVRLLSKYKIIEYGSKSFFKSESVDFNQKPQKSFNKNFDMLWEFFQENLNGGFTNAIVCDNPKQSERLYTIYEDQEKEVNFKMVKASIHEGFVDEQLKLNAFTDHQIFERYHRFKLKEGFRKSKQALTIKELSSLEPGDYVAHIDHGIGKFSGLEKLDVNGKKQEAIRLEYSGGDILYVSIHSLHRISKYTGKEGTQPKVHRLGSPTWQNLKNKTKKKVKEIAFDLIKLYAKRKAAKGFAYAPDGYLQTELEASFIYEDTPDQYTATQAIKEDLESDTPMDRLICGDVGFGKTEVAIRAAFKAATDGKQVAVLVPTTVLCLQHYNSFRKRLKEFPVTIDYISRLKTTKENNETLKRLESGEIDIIIGTHKLIGKSVKFQDLGLMIIDEEQKFGVAVKDKLKTLKANVDCLTLTATPIPRTLQFSLMGARDLSIIKTPPPNRYPVETEIRGFNEEWIRDAIMQEVERGGQVFFVHNRVQNIKEIAGMLQSLVPGVRIAVGHGQMEPKKLEEIMVEFTDGLFDVLVATTIIESGIDVSNANTIIINQAQNFGLSDLHQLRGRVGRSNKKAFCYLITPPLHHLPPDSRKRLQALEQFSDLGSGMDIAMRDLDIRGAGDMLGGEQSGFISDIGFETYTKILNDTVKELKQNEFKDLFEDAEEDYVEECVLETDMELLLPDYYVNNIRERLILYKELDDIETQEALDQFEQNLKDRFGDIPEQSKALLETLPLRWKGQDIGFEKLVLKKNKLIGYFKTEDNDDYFKSELFGRVIAFMQSKPENAQLKDNKGRLYLTFTPCKGIAEANKVLEAILNVKTS